MEAQTKSQNKVAAPKTDWARVAIKASAITSIGGGIVTAIIGMGISSQSHQYIDAARQVEAITPEQREAFKTEVCTANASQLDNQGLTRDEYMQVCAAEFDRQASPAALREKAEGFTTIGRSVTAGGGLLVVAGIGGLVMNRRRKSALAA